MNNTRQVLYVFNYKHADMDGLLAYMLDCDFSECLHLTLNFSGLTSRLVFIVPLICISLKLNVGGLSILAGLLLK